MLLGICWMFWCFCFLSFFYFFFNDTATTEIYTLSLHDALPISGREFSYELMAAIAQRPEPELQVTLGRRSEEHTSELQSRLHLVCRPLLEKKKKTLRLSAYRTPSSARRSTSPTCDTI